MIEKKVSGTYHGTISEFVKDMGSDVPIIAQLSNTDVVVLNKKGFNDLTDLVAFDYIENLDMGDIIKLAFFVGELRRVLFEEDDKTEKEEN